MTDNLVLPGDLVQTFAETSRRLYVSEDLDETLGRVTAVAVDVVPGCQMASVSLLEGHGGISTRGATDSWAERIDAIQYEVGEGPCLTAASDADLVYTADAARDERWPRFSRRVGEEAGIGSLLSCRLAVTASPTRTLGSLNLYATERNSYGDADILLSLLLAANAAIVVDAARVQANLRQALETRDVIGQAKGILMAHSNLTADEAFDRLRHASQRLNTKLRDVAARIAARRRPEDE